MGKDIGKKSSDENPTTEQERLLHLASSLGSLTSEHVNPASDNLDALSAFDVAKLMNDQDQGVAHAISLVLGEISQAIEMASKSIKNGGRLIYVGAGTSGRLGILDASEIPPTFSAPDNLVMALIAGGKPAMFRAVEDAEDDVDQGALDIASLDVTDLDFVVGLAVSGRTPYVLGAIAEAQRRGAATAGICCNADSPLEDAVDIAIVPLVGAEVLTGSTRLKSGTAQKMVLNMISTGAMVQLGKCYGNRMVDLTATNEKLRARAFNLVCELTQADRVNALAALVAADWDIKIAILCVKSGVTPDAARDLLLQSGGQLRHALMLGD